MSIVISTGDICIEGCLDVSKAEEKGFNGGCIFILLFFSYKGGQRPLGCGCGFGVGVGVTSWASHDEELCLKKNYGKLR